MSRSSTHDQRRTIAVAIAGLCAVAFCGWRWWLQPREAAARRAEQPALIEARTAALGRVADLGLELDPTASSSAPLRWLAPRECVEVYRLAIDEHHRDASVAGFVGRDEEHSRWLLALGPRPRRSGGAFVSVLIPLATETETETERVRELGWSATAVGPAAPDFACRRRSWDPVEDALALGWPRLPGRRVRVGESWQGAAVEGRCHETTCLDDTGRFPHDRPCRARPWREQLVSADDDGSGLALVLGDWDDGHDPARSEIGILTSRTLILDEGRPLHVHARVDHRWSGVRRELELMRIDDCGARSLAGPGDAALVDDARTRFE